MPTTLLKKIAFSASHYYWLPHWTEAKNHTVFGPCSNQQGHGHNYEVVIGLTGDINPETGMIINFDQLDPLLNETVITPYDHKLINTQVSGFTQKIPTLENITQDIRNRLLTGIQCLNLQLENLQVIETDTLWLHWMPNKELTLTKQYQYSAAHQLYNPNWSSEKNKSEFGACANLHGHTYLLEVSISGPVDEETGMIIPLSELDNLVQQQLLDKVDHRFLDQDVDFIVGKPSTVEVLSQLFFKELAPHIPKPAHLQKIQLFESPQNSASYCLD